MFEIRVICDVSDTDRIVTALDSTFTAGTVSVYPTNDGKRNRLYVMAEHSEDAEDVDAWPVPERAYAKAPSIISEIGWVAEESIGRPTGAFQNREFWLRRAALLDRIALDDGTVVIRTDAPEVALNAARKLLDVDRDGVGSHGGAPYWPEHPKAIADPRGYVRQEYARWAKHQ